jgi:hypothetical protein
MKITKATTGREGSDVTTDLGRFGLYGNPYHLHAGVVCMLGSEVPSVPEIIIPSIGPQPDLYPEGFFDSGCQELRVRKGTTDAQLLCIQRRSFARSSEGGYDDDIPIPSLEEAIKENVSKEPVYGIRWGVPRLPTVSLDEAIEEAKKGNQ